MERRYAYVIIIITIIILYKFSSFLDLHVDDHQEALMEYPEYEFIPGGLEDQEIIDDA